MDFFLAYNTVNHTSLRFHNLKWLNIYFKQSNQEPNEKFRGYEEIKKEMKNLNMLVTTETDLMRELIGKYLVTVQKEEKIQILKDLEYYVHQVKK
jgi:hypothetical protein